MELYIQYSHNHKKKYRAQKGVLKEVYKMSVVISLWLVSQLSSFQNTAHDVYHIFLNEKNLISIIYDLKHLEKTSQ